MSQLKQQSPIPTPRKIVESNNGELKNNDHFKFPKASPSATTPKTAVKMLADGETRMFEELDARGNPLDDQRALFEEGDGPASRWKEIAIEHRKTLDQLQSTLDAR